MSKRKPLFWTVESRHETTCSSRGKRVWGSELTSVKRTVGCRWIDIGNIVIKLVLTFGFVISMCTLSCSVRTTLTKQIEDDVRNFREEIKPLQREVRNLLNATNAMPALCEKTADLRKSVEEATWKVSVLTNGVSEITKTFECRLKKPLFAPLIFCPCCWRFYE